MGYWRGRMQRLVRGALFADYVRMIRSFKGVAWDKLLGPEDFELVRSRISVDSWYPMAAFERLGDVILVHVAGGSLEAVRAWGRVTVDQLRALDPELVAPGDPAETLQRFHQFRREFFNFDPIEVTRMSPQDAVLEIQYFMGPSAEEAASYQAMGFFERLLEAAGARDVRPRFRACSWADDAVSGTVLELAWKPPGGAKVTR